MSLMRSLGATVFLALTLAATTAAAQMPFEPFEFGGSAFKHDPGAGIGHGQGGIDGYRFDMTPALPSQRARGHADAALDGGFVVERSGLASISATLAWTERLNQSDRDDPWSRRLGVVPEPASPVTTWTAIVSGLPAPPPQWVLLGRRPVPIDAWIMQAEALLWGAN